MKQSILFAALGLSAFGAFAQEVGLVLSSTPVVQQVSVPRTVCTPVAPSQVTTTGGGAAVGGLTGAGVGSMIGSGSGNTAAIAVGTIMGAIIGNNVEAQNQRYAQTYPQCTTQTAYENRTIGYDVVYEYAGRQFSARLPYNPGRTVQLQVSALNQSSVPAAPAVATAQGGISAEPNGVVVAPPVQQAQAAPAPVPTPTPIVQVAPQQAPVVVQQAPAQVVYAPYPAAYPAPYPAAYPAPYPAYGYGYPYPYYRPYAPVGVSLGFVFSNGHRHRHR